MAERIIKPWGWSQEVYRDELTRVVRIHVEPGGFCSWHKHERQVNYFWLISGSISVERLIRDPADQPRRIATDLDVKEKDGIVPGVCVSEGWIHRFISYGGCEAIEVYTSTDGSPPDESDIVRFNEGGIRSPSS